MHRQPKTAFGFNISILNKHFIIIANMHMRTYRRKLGVLAESKSTNRKTTSSPLTMSFSPTMMRYAGAFLGVFVVGVDV